MKDPEFKAKMELNLSKSPSRSGFFSQTTREKLSQSRKGSSPSAPTRKRLRLANLGKKASLETRKKMSESRKGKPGKKGRVQSPEERARRSEIQKRRCADPEEKKRRSKIQQLRWNRAGNKHKPETIEKMKIARAKQVIPMRDTKPERAVQKILDGMGLKYRKHLPLQGLGHHQWDLVLQELRLIIEVDGCYWHACPRCYPNSKIGKKNRKNDRILNDRAEAQGWAVLRIWEHHVNDDKARQLVAVMINAQQLVA